MIRRIRNVIGPLIDAYRACHYVEDIDADKLKSLGAEAVILDHDGILGASRARWPDDEGVRLIKNLVAEFGENKIFILSNTRSAKSARAKYFRENWSQVKYLDVARKPDPEGFNMVAAVSSVTSGKIAVIDDGMLTGVLMAVENGGLPIYALRRQLDETITLRLIRIITTAPQYLFVRLMALF